MTVSGKVFFRDLLDSSRKSVVRGAMFGDSQETSPWGWGMHYVPFVNAGLAEVFGPCTETMLLTNVDMVERPQWLATVMRAACAGSPEGLSPTSVLPGIAVDRLDGPCEPGGEYRAVLLHDASRVVDPRLAGGTWLAPSPEYQVDALVLSGPQASALDWRAEPTDEDYPAARAVSQSGELAFAAAPRTGGLAWASTPPLGRGSRRHLQVAIDVSAGRPAVDLVGVRFRVPGKSSGVVVQSFSRGGQRATDLRGSHGNAADMLRALAPAFAIMQLGANDAMEMVAPEAWRGRLVDAIAWIRETVGDPRFPVIVVSDIRGGSGGLPFEIIDRMPAIAHSLALEDDRLLAINMRRITEEDFLWGLTTHYLADQAHFHPFAQRLLAHAFVGELCGALGFGVVGCEGALGWADCVRSVGSACGSGGCIRMLDVEAEHYGVPWISGTSCEDTDGDGVADECPPGGRADLDRDGFVGGTDLGILLGAWGLDHAVADIDASGTVDGSDLGVLLSAWTAG